ncbi:hypothetical protein [Methylotenera sp.]|uniref:hypothetical protein n=1 Tax=Methylotenera sp. TaxID=2051956 RepID=UPI0025EC4082|nr:hypothetical protein [Methylotenera sp.]
MRNTADMPKYAMMTAIARFCYMALLPHTPSAAIMTATQTLASMSMRLTWPIV